MLKNGGVTEVMEEHLIYKEVYAGIVTFNPNLKALEDNILSVYNQVNEIVIVDNASENVDRISEVIKQFSKIILIKNHENRGIACALNQLMNFGEINQYSYMLTLDQDSKCPSDYIQEMLPFFKIDKRIAVVAPVIKDVNIGVVGHAPSPYGFVKTCITSGSVVSIEAWKEIGGYDELLFIDSVDFDFCYRLRKAKYLILQTDRKYLIHEIGNGEVKKILFWKVNVTNHSPFRKYYISRNNIYYPLKNRMYLRFLRGIIRDIWLIFIVLFFEDCKVSKIKNIIKGMHDAFVIGKENNEN
ncbi:TPA: glycosyltransferase family 2 protein [Streptococcus suis]|nr:glycosyltransferase family 2 protein [Streptococcus suis]HEL1908876.1 glycosyltransferase family 2 protein [Streptococcus suis]